MKINSRSREFVFVVAAILVAKPIPLAAASSSVSVPNVVGDTQPAATTALTNAGLVNGTFTYQPSSSVTSGDVISESPSAGTSVAAGSAVNLVISTGSFNSFEAVSNLFSAQNGPIGSQALPTGQNEAVSDLISVQNGVIGSLLLPAGQNEAVSNLISIQNGAIGSGSLPKGENEAVSDLISVQNGAIGSLLLPTGRNEAVSNLISAENGGTGSATTKLKKAGFALGSENGNDSGAAIANGAVLNAGETLTATADVRAQIFLNGERAGNDPNSATDLTFAVPEGSNSLRIRAGQSGEKALIVQRQTRVLTGQVVDANGSPVANAAIHLRHSGLQAEFFQLSPNTPADEAPSIAGLQPTSAEPVSSLNLHNPAQAFGYFPIGDLNAPSFAVRLSGQFLAQESGSYVFFVAATEGAQLSIDGKQAADVRAVKPGLEGPAPVQLTAGWHDIQLLVYSTSGAAELVVNLTPPGGVRQTISPALLRGESTGLRAMTDSGGKFKISAPAWLDRIEAIATSSSSSGLQSGVSAAAESGASSLGQIHLAPGTNF